jgi:hypothetical protein
MDSEGGLIVSVLLGAIGLGYGVYAKQQRNPVVLVCAIGLMVFPYFVSSVWLMLLIGAALIAAPWYIKF